MNHLLQQIYCLIIEVLAHLANVFIRVHLPLGERQLHLGKICETLPGLLCWGAHCSKNSKDLTDLRITGKERLLMG